MKHSTLEHLQCPGSRERYRATSHAQIDGCIEFGYLSCRCAATVIPIVDGFVMFTEPLLHGGLATLPSLRSLSAQWFGTAQKFEHLYRQKRDRQVFESYAAFQPFNESSRAMEPLLPLLRSSLVAGDLILDVWCRTGWSGEWLAGLFPDQHVIALWEGDSSVLGYRGFRHLLGTRKRSANLDIFFTNAERPLPFASESFALLHGHDALHRKELYPFAAECLRVTRYNGAIVFPHVHLSNSQPEPFFERGGTIRHGRDYRLWLDSVTEGSGRRGLVCSEQTLFEQSLVGHGCAEAAARSPVMMGQPPPSHWRDEADTTHYNGLVSILPLGEASVAVSSAHSHGARSIPVRYLVNPLFRINLSRSTARVASQSLGGGGGELLLRHPVYEERLPAAPIGLTQTGLLLTILVAAGLEHTALMESVPDSLRDTAAELAALSDSELFRPARISAAAHDLQCFHSNQWLPNRDWWPERLERLRSSSATAFRLPDGTDITGSEVSEFILRVPSALRSLGVGPGDWIGIDAGEETLLWLTTVGAAIAGVNVDLEGVAPLHGQKRKLRLQQAPPPRNGDVRTMSLRGTPDCFLDKLEVASPLSKSGAATATGSVTGDGSGTCMGTLRFSLGGGHAQCTIRDLGVGCLALEKQLEPPLRPIGGRDPLIDLLGILLVVSCTGPALV